MGRGFFAAGGLESPLLAAPADAKALRRSALASDVDSFSRFRLDVEVTRSSRNGRSFSGFFAELAELRAAAADLPPPTEKLLLLPPLDDALWVLLWRTITLSRVAAKPHM